MKLKRLLASILCLAMVLSTMGFSAFAAGNSTEAEAVAMYNGEYYHTVQDAIADASAGDTIYVLKDIETLGRIEKAVTLEGRLNGVEGAKVTLTKQDENGGNGGENQFGNIDGTVTLSNFVYEYASLAIRFEYSQGDYAKLNLVVDNCTFNNINNYVIMGGAGTGYGDKVLGSLKVTNCVFNVAEDATKASYIVYAQRCKNVTVDNCTFNGNGIFRGAIHLGDGLENDDTVSTISGNTISKFERAVVTAAQRNENTVTVTGNTITDTESAVYLHENIKEGTVEVGATQNEFLNVTTIINNKNDDVTTEDLVTSFSENTAGGLNVDVDGKISVAKIGNTTYSSLAEALNAAQDGETIELISGNTPISAAGAVYGKTVTITGNAVFDWSKGWLFAGRGGEGNGTLIFDNANITSASDSSSFGIHVSGREKETEDKYDGTLIIKDSTIELDYLINRNSIDVDNSTFTVKNGFGIAGRPASETESGADATATINITNNSYVKVLNHNGMGVGVTSATPEGKGVLNLTDSTFECASFNIDADLGDFNVYGESTLKIDALTGKEIDLQHNATINESTVGGEVMLYGKVTFSGDNTFKMLYDYGDAYSDEYAEWIVEEGASVTLTEKARYGLGYGDKLTVYGDLTNALTARDTLTADNASLFMHGLVAMSNWDVPNSLTVKDAYVVIGSNNSFGNSPKSSHKGTYNINFENSVLDASRITFYEAPSNTTFNITNSDFEIGTFMTRDADSVFTLTNSKVVSTTATNGTDEGNYNAGNLNLVNSSLTYSAPVSNTGVITLDTGSTLTAPSISGAGTINIDVTNYDGYGDLSNVINADLSGFTGTVNAIGNNVDVKFENGVLTFTPAPVGGPIIGYTGEDRIWGETHANSKESYVVKVYSGDTLMGQSSLNNINNIIDGDLAPTWNVKLNPTNAADDYWTTTWTVAPSMDCQPTHIALVVDDVEVSRTAIQLNGPDNLNKIYAAVTDADGKILSYATSLENAFNKVADGGRIELLRDVELSKAIAFTKDITFTLDGNGYTVKPAKGSKETNSAFNLGQGSDSTRATRKYNIENVVFEGWTTDHIIRLQGTTSVISDCTFRNNNQPDGLGLVTATFADVTVENCVFEDNTCVACVDVNSWGDDSVSNSVVDNCIFENNTVSGAGVVFYNDGASLTVTDNEFVSNTVNTTGNGATLYMGFNGGSNVTGNLFENNTVTTTLDRTTRVAGAIFAGFADENCEITENVFVNNTATANGNVAASGIAYSAYYGAGNLDGNYWGGGEPVSGVDYTHEYPEENDLTVEKYYDEYSLDADGNAVLSDLKPIVSKVVAVQYVENVAESDPDTGLKVYDIVIVAKDEHIINRLNTADLTFANSSDKIAYEIVAAEDITLTHNTDYPNRYMFNFNGKDNVADTDVALTIGQVRLTGYDAFTFQVADASTNLVTATTIDDNIVSYYAADGLELNTDADGDGKYLGVIDTEIAVPTRELTINITFPNAVVNNAVDYQDMTVTIVGGTVNETIALGTDGEAYNFSRVLPYNTAYTVTVSGAGYRTARYTVTMTDDKQLNFWNNVMDEAQVVEIGKDSSVAKVTFLAGDIVKDNNINIYDLSAVVSYFGTENLVEDHPEYAKYDLNRDGVIDSKDVAYVLVSWNN